jgi:AAHS family 4-hydroxybenzoate transporter-like MFS transporter
LRPVILPSLQLPPRLCAERHSGIWFPVQSADCTAFSS